MKKVFIPLLFIFCLLFSGCNRSLKQVSKTLSSYNIIATFDEDNKTLTASQMVTYVNNSDTVIKTLPFHLYPNAFREDAKYKPVSFASEDRAYPNGLSFGGIDITCLKVNGKLKDIVIAGEDENILEVALDNLYPDEKTKIYMEYKVTLPNCHHRLGYGENTYNFGNFYPIACAKENGEFMQKVYSYNGDPFFSDMANYSVEICVNENFVLASSGSQTSQITTNNKTTYKIKAKTIRDFAFVLSKDFEVKSAKVNDTQVSYYYFNDANANQSLKTSKDSLVTFEKLFGDYPYETLNVVQTDFVHGGMEYPNIVYISEDINLYDDYTNVIVHEIAHQWWYGLVGNNEYDEAWLDEGLAEMSCLLFYEHNPSYNISVSGKKKLLHQNYAMFLDVFHSVYGKVDQSMTRSLNEYKSETEYTYITYVKGNIMFADMQKVMGKKKFLKALKKYFKDNIYTNAQGENLIASFVAIGGKKMEKFINSYLSGKVVISTK